MDKKTVCLSLLIALTLSLLSSCTKEEGKSQQPVRIAMLAFGTTFDDHAFLQSCKTGLEKAKLNFNIQPEYDIDTTQSAYEERLNSYGDKGFDLIIAVGYMWNDAVAASAKKHPGSRYVLVDAQLSEPQANAISILFNVDEVAFPLGYLSAWWADHNDPQSPMVGYIGAFSIPQIRQFTIPYQNGVKRYNQEKGRSVGCTGVFANTFISSATGETLADSLILAGIDVIFGVGGQTGNGALLKARERNKQAIGVDVDQCISYPEVSGALISSAMKNLDNAIYSVVRSFVNGSLNTGGIYTGNLNNQGVGTAPYHKYDSLIPFQVKREIDEIKVGIMIGTISTGW